MKRFYAVLAAVMMIVMLPVMAMASSSGTYGTNVTWVLDDAGTLTISGSGEMTDYSNSADIPWDSSRSSIKKVIINKGVTSIGEMAFIRCGNLTSVSIPNSVKKIESFAFEHCESLASITIPSSVTLISGGAFEYCSALTSISIPSSVTSIGSGAFEGCSSLESLTVASGNTVYRSSGNCILKGNTLIATCKSSVIPSSITSIWYSAFAGRTDLTSIVIPSSVKSIDAYAFYECTNLTSVSLPSGITSIENGTFWNCTSLTSINIPSNVTSVGEKAFYNCSSLELDYPTSVTSVGTDAFYNVKKLTCGMNSSAAKMLGAANSAFTDSSYPSLKLQWTTDGTQLNVVGCDTSATSITIPSGAAGISSKAFYDCNSLASISIPSTVTSIGDSAFYSCTGLTSINVPSSMASIGNYAFRYCTGLTSINIPSSVKSIGKCAFQGCTSLTLDFPSSVTSVGTNAFYNIKKLTCEMNSSAAKLLGTVSCSFTDPSYPSLKLQWTTDGTQLNAVGCDDSATSITIPSGVNGISNSAFKNCTNLKSVSILSAVTSIGSYTFYGCSGLTNISIPSSVTSIERYTFCGCSGLTSISIPSSVTSIEYSAFSGCSALQHVDFDGSQSQWSALIKNISSSNEAIRNLGFVNSESENGVYCFMLDMKYNANGGSCSTAFKAVSTGSAVGELPVPYRNGYTFLGWYTGATDGSQVYSSYNVTQTSDFTVYAHWEVGISWDLTDGTLTISGTGKIVDYNSSSYAPWYDRRSSIKKVIIGSDVSAIGSYAFYGCSNLESVSILTNYWYFSIGSYAFYGCSSLTGINIPDGFDYIGAYAFSGCTSLSSIDIPSGSKTIGSHAFSGCTSLATVNFEKDSCSYTSTSWIHLGSYAFSGCTALKSVVNLIGVNPIAEGTFKGCTSLESVKLPQWEIGVEKEAFYGCSSLTLTCPDSFSSIGTDAFKGVKKMVCGVNSTIAKKLGAADCSFSDPSCTSLELQWTTNGKQLNVVSCDNSEASLAIPSGVTGISADAFYNCTNLTSISIPTSVTSIGSGAFYNCSGLESISVTSGNKVFQSSGNCLMKGNILVAGCKNSSIPNNVTSIGEGAFYGCSGLKSINISSSSKITSIGNYAFQDCSSLESFTVPTGMKSFGNNAFDGCTALSTVNWNSNLKTWVNIKRGSGMSSPNCYATKFVVSGNNNIVNIVIKDTDNITTIPAYAFRGFTSVTSVTVSKSVTAIADHAFDGCSKIKTVAYTGTDAMWCKIKITEAGNSYLISARPQLDLSGGRLYLPSALTSIATGAFRGNPAVAVNIPDSCTSIGKDAFADCPNLIAVFLPVKLKNKIDGCFSNSNGTEISFIYQGEDDDESCVDPDLETW